MVDRHHPDFPNLWIFHETIAISTKTLVPEIARDVYQQNARNYILKDQVVHGKRNQNELLLISNGVQLSLPLHMTQSNGAAVVAIASPFWPPHKVVGGTHGRMAAPYVVNDTNAHFLGVDYDSNSPRVDLSLAKPIGHVFETPELKSTDLWWTTNEDNVWWPKTKITDNVLGIVQIPRTLNMCGCLGQTITERAAPIPGWHTTMAFGGKHATFILLMIVVEYSLIPIGAVAGANQFGWSVELQLIYMACLLALVLFEMILIAALMPNGTLWLRMNVGKLPIAIIQSVLWRWDLYSDVGFVVLAYTQRARTSAPLWAYSLVLTLIVIVGRLVYTCSHLKKLIHGKDETVLAKISIPAFLTVIQLVCQGIKSDEGREARRVSARTLLAFELLRSFVEDFPEIAIQAAYLYGGSGPPACIGCEYGFVFVSLLVSVATAVPGLKRIYQSYQQYQNVRSECGSVAQKGIADQRHGKQKEISRESDPSSFCPIEV